MFYNVMYSSLHGSMVLDRLAMGFDRTVIMDVLNTESNILDSTVLVAIILAAVYLIISIFIQGGWLGNIRKRNFGVKSQLSNGRKYFLPFTGIAAISLLLVFLYALIVGTGFTFIVGDPLATFSSEKPYVLWLVALAFIWTLWCFVVWAWSVSSRYHYIDGQNFISALKKGMHSIKTQMMEYLFLGGLLLISHVFLMVVYYMLMGDRGAPSWWIVIIGIIIQQSFAIIHITLRGFGYGYVDSLVLKH